MTTANKGVDASHEKMIWILSTRGTVLDLKQGKIESHSII